MAINFNKPLVENVAFALHEKWRKKFLDRDGSYKSQWREIKDAKYISQLDKNDLPKYVRKTDKGFEMDFTNAVYNQLSEDWRLSDNQIAQVIIGLLDTKLYPDQACKIIHEAWLKQNAWSIGHEIHVPYEQLAKADQDDILDLYFTALIMYKAQVVELQYINSCDDIMKNLNDAKKSGNNLAFNYKGIMIYSAFDSLDTVYLKLCGRTYQEQQEAIKRDLAEDNKNESEKREQAKQNFSLWIEKGNELIYPERQRAWKKCVKQRAFDEFYGKDLDNALEVMKALNEGKSTQEALIFMLRALQTPKKWTTVLNIVTVFSKRGPEFYRSFNNNIDRKTLKDLEKLEKENAKYAIKHEEEMNY